MPQYDGKQVFPTFLGIAWCVTVLASYYAYNYQYYVEKISVFGKFFIELVG